MARTKDNSGDNNRQLILDIARRLIMDQGVQGTSISDIAREAEMSKGTLFYYYPSKNSLIYDITEQHFDHVTSNLRQRFQTMLAAGASPSDFFKMGFSGVIDEETRGRLNLYLVQDAVTGNDELKARFKDKYQEWRDEMYQTLQITFPQVDPDNLRLLSYIVVACMDGLIIQHLLDPENIPVAKIAEYLSSIVE